MPSTRTTATLVPRLADDVIAVAHHLRVMGHRRVGLLGSSMGGWVNVAAAARSATIDFIVNINGGGSSVGVSDEFDRLTDEGRLDDRGRHRGGDGTPVPPATTQRPTCRASTNRRSGSSGLPTTATRRCSMSRRSLGSGSRGARSPCWCWRRPTTS
ncbi:MAG: alpha/beta hydrolase [Gemmatimonadales bacterium]|nr:alpha/beta hydrolase [Gemmatimonadales bacterium]